MSERPTGPKCVVSGSFRKHYGRILEVCAALAEAGAVVLSPARSEVVNPDDEFVLLQTDLWEWGEPEIKHVEDAVLRKIAGGDFVYVCNPDGYVGLSTAFEIGYAVSLRRPVIAMCPPADPTLLRYIDAVAAPDEAVARVSYLLATNEPAAEGAREEEPMLERQISRYAPTGER